MTCERRECGAVVAFDLEDKFIVSVVQASCLSSNGATGSQETWLAWAFRLDLNTSRFDESKMVDLVSELARKREEATALALLRTSEALRLRDLRSELMT